MCTFKVYPDKNFTRCKGDRCKATSIGTVYRYGLIFPPTLYIRLIRRSQLLCRKEGRVNGKCYINPSTRNWFIVYFGYPLKLKPPIAIPLFTS